MAAVIANKAKYCLSVGDIDFANDSFKIILMDTGFTFNKDTHHSYSDVSSDELATGGGYTQDTKTLTGVSVTENDTTDKTEVEWGDVSWTATTGGIGPTAGFIIYDDTVTTAGTATIADPIIEYVPFDSEITQAAGADLVIQNIQVDIE